MGSGKLLGGSSKARRNATIGRLNGPDQASRAATPIENSSVQKIPRIIKINEISTIFNAAGQAACQPVCHTGLLRMSFSTSTKRVAVFVPHVRRAMMPLQQMMTEKNPLSFYRRSSKGMFPHL